MSDDDLEVVSVLEQKVAKTCTCTWMVVVVHGSNKESKAQ